MSRKLFLLLFALLAAMLLAGNSALAQPPAPTVDDYVDDVEPNDIPAQAQSVVYGDWIRGSINSYDSVDYYRFEGQAGEVVALSKVSNWSDHLVILLDSSLNPLPLQGYSSWAILPGNDTYYIRIAWDEEEDSTTRTPTSL